MMHPQHAAMQPNGAPMRVSSNSFRTRKRWVVAGSAMVLTLGVLHAGAQDAARVQPQATAEDVLASLVHHSAVIFAGEVYAIRVPASMKATGGVTGGLPSSRPDAVEVEFRVDMGIRGTTIGNNYELRMPVSAWQQAPPFTLHQRSVIFLTPADACGLRRPGGRRVRSSRNGPRRDAGGRVPTRST